MIRDDSAVTIFLIGKGVEALTIESQDFDIKQKSEDFIASQIK